jgi:phosphoribosylformylglycinamidine synthase
VLHGLLASPNLCSREWIQRQYDHEVQGGSAVKFMTGRDRNIPNDAAVIRPVLERPGGLAVAQALNPVYSEIDTYDMVAATIDEAVRRIVAVGGRLDEIGGVDNFCWPNIQYDPIQNPDGRYKAAQLVRANLALRDLCLEYGIPLLSGKDSMYVDGYLSGRFGERHKISGLPAMQFTATGIVPDVLNAQTMEAKSAGDLVYVLGATRNELGGSAYYDMFGYVGLNVPKVEPERFYDLYRTVETAVASGLTASCHGIYRGGIAVHAAMAAFGGRLGMTLDLARVPIAGDDAIRDDQVLFSESCGRFLVTVPGARQAEFEAMLRALAPSSTGGAPYGPAGEVTETPELVIIGRSGNELLKENIFSLQKSWMGQL